MNNCNMETESIGGGNDVHKSPTFSILRNTSAEPDLSDNFTADDVQRFLNDTVDKLEKEKWVGELVLPVIPISAAVFKSRKVNDVLSSQLPIMTDICKSIGGGGDPSIVALYLDPKQYKPPEQGTKYTPSASLKSKKVGDKQFQYECEDDKVFTELKDRIERISIDNDCSVICNGRNGSCSNSRKFVCEGLYRTRKDCKSKDDSDTSKKPPEYRPTYMIKNDKRGRREGGKSLPRRRAVSQPLVEEGEGDEKKKSLTCPFKVVLKWDEYGYFFELRRNAGCCDHMYHPQPVPRSTPLPARLLTDEEVETVRNVTDSTFNNGAGRNYLYTTLDKHMSRAKVAYLTSRDDQDKDEIERMFDFMKESDDVSYNICWDPSKSADESTKKPAADTKCTTLPERSEPTLVSTTKTNGEVTHVDVAEDPTMHHIATEVDNARTNQNINEDESVFVSIAWTLNGARRLFKLNPEVVTCDITSHTNKNGYHLLTFSVKTSHDRQVVFLWVWMPNQRRYSFRWVFQHAVTNLIAKIHLLRVKFFMKDGDPQQHNEIVAAIRSIFRNAGVGGCGWHIVHCTWVKYIGKAQSVIRKENWDKWANIQRIIQSYIYCWMRRGGVNDDDEYELSKKILFDFLHGPLVNAVCDGNQVFIKSIVYWLENHVLVHENLFLAHRRKAIRHFGTAHSSPHEGTNFGAKSSAASVKPTMSMDKSAQALCLQSNIKTEELNELAYHDYMKRNKKWSCLPSAPHSCRHAEGLLTVVFMRRKLYAVYRVGQFIFDVEFCGDGSDMKDVMDCGIFPLFWRVHRVTISRDGKLSCSCCAFEEDGIPCPHIASVIDSIMEALGIEWKGFTICDVSVRWWSSYMYLAYQPSTDEKVNAWYHWLATNDIKGPTLPCQVCNISLEITEPQEKLPAIQRLKNYSPDEIIGCGKFDGHLESSVHECNDAESAENAQLSQFSYATAAEDLFEESIRDEVGCEATGVGIRSSLNQLWNEACDAAEQAGDPDINAELAQHLRNFVDSAHAKTREKNGSKKRKRIVPLLPSKYQGPPRVFNTHHMG